MKSQRNTKQMKEKKRKTEVQINEEERAKLYEKQFLSHSQVTQAFKLLFMYLFVFWTVCLDPHL